MIEIGGYQLPWFAPHNDSAGMGSIATAAASTMSVDALPSKATYSVPANALALHPCLTRSILRGRGWEGDGSMLSFDNLGCMIDPINGWRVPEDCGPRGVERRTLCPGGPQQITNDALDRLAGVVSIIAQAMPAIISSVGPGLATMFSPIINEIGAAAATLFGQGFRDFMAWIDRQLNQLFAGEALIAGTAMKTFRTLGGVAKSIADALGAASIDSVRIAAIPGVRNGLGIASKLLAGHVPSINAIEDHAWGVMVGITSYASALIAKDARKSLVVLQEAVRYAKDTRGSIDASMLSNFASTIPDLTMVSAAGMDAAVRRTSREAGLIADEIATRFHGARDNMINDLDGAAIAALLPIGRQLDFLKKFDAARAFGDVIAPYVTAADQLTRRVLDQAHHMLTDASAFPEYAALRMEDYQAEIRRVLERGVHDADALVEQGATEAKLRASTAPKIIPPPRQTYDSWIAQRLNDNESGLLTRVAWPIERGVA